MYSSVLWYGATLGRGYGSSESDQIAQFLQNNCFSKQKEQATTHQHSKDRETSLPAYIGMVVYAKTKKRNFEEVFCDYNISISYDRVLEIPAQLWDGTITMYVEEGVVCPAVLKKGLFTTVVMNNIDHNPSETTATTPYHGTNISVLQHPASDNHREELHLVKFRPERAKICSWATWFLYKYSSCLIQIKELNTTKWNSANANHKWPRSMSGWRRSLSLRR